MSTNPPPDLLDRDLSIATARHGIDRAEPMLIEIVNYGVAVFARCLPAINEDGEHNLAILMCLRHLLEMIDSVQIQLSSGAPDPAVLQLRSAFEALISLEYILKADTARRCFAYLAGNTHREIQSHWILMEDHDGGGQPWPHFKANLDTFMGRLDRPGWMEAHASIMAAGTNKKGRLRLVDWYRAYGGPETRAALAATVNRKAQYDILYRTWSDATHATDAFNQLRARKQTLELKRLRQPQIFPNVASFAANFGMEGARAVLLHYRPSEERANAQWYVDEVRDAYVYFSNEKVST